VQRSQSCRWRCQSMNLRPGPGDWPRHAESPQQTGVAHLLLRPAQPWQRGSNENITALIASTCPGDCLSGTSAKRQLNAIALETEYAHPVNASISMPDRKSSGEVMQESHGACGIMLPAFKSINRVAASFLQPPLIRNFLKRKKPAEAGPF